jgi:hypothetical protein
MKKIIFMALFLVGVLFVSGCEWEEMTGNLLKKNSASLQADKSLTLKGSTESNSGWLDNLKQSLSASSKSQFSLGKGGMAPLKEINNETHCLDADYNEDLKVDISDLGIFAEYYSNQSLEGDLNNDGETNLADLAVFATYYNNCDYSNQSIVYCEDTDGGINYYVKGTVYGTMANGTTYNLTDRCFSDRIFEYYCYGPSENITWDIDSYACDCYDGVCAFNNQTDNPPVIEELELDWVSCGVGGGNGSNGSISCDVYYHVYATDDYGITSAQFELDGPIGGQGASWPVNNLTSYYRNFTFYNLDDMGNYTLYFTVYDDLSQGDLESVYFSLP